MISTIIVDDDVEMLNGLTSLICWEDYGFRIDGKAKNGFEALKLVTKHAPDVIVTDITMPVMGGLELLREAKKFKPEIHGVIISCHEDFEYAREAIRLEADEYLIKHTMTEEVLVKALLSLSDKLQKRKKQQEALTLATRGLNMNRYTIFSKFFNDVIEGISGSQAAEQAAVSAIPLPPSRYRVISFFVDDESEPQRIATQYGSFEYCVSSVIEESVCDIGKCVLFPFGKDSFVLLLWEDEILREAMDGLMLCLDRVRANVRSVLGVVLSICVGGVYSSVSELKTAISEAALLRTGYFYDVAGAIVTQMPVYKLADLRSIYREFAPRMKQKDTEELLEVSRDLFENQYEQYEPSAVKALLNRLLIEIPADYVRIDIPHINGNTFDICKKMFENSIRRISENSTRSETSHEGIQKAIDYIDTHLGEDISCEGVASYINMNSSYFSRLFKREMRVNISDYILHKRMQAATELLIHSNCSVDEIADTIGIESISYFYRAYKRITGNTPGDVRNKARSSIKL